MTSPEKASTGATALKVHAADNVAVALRRLEVGETPRIADDPSAPPLRETIPTGHKFALIAIEPGAPVVKFGQIIGYAAAAIQPGCHVHLHNLIGVSARTRAGEVHDG